MAWSIRNQGDVNLAEVQEGLGPEDLGARTARRDNSSHVDIYPEVMGFSVITELLFKHVTIS